MADAPALAAMSHALWPDGAVEEHRKEMETLLQSGRSGTLPAVIFIAEDSGDPIGFVQAGLRSHADGCDPAQRVGFIEGWFVAPPHRRRGVGEALIDAAAAWARKHGCRELASDTWSDHALSQRAHEALGFEVVDRCVHYRRPLD
jgi:aminoglycoside 6'-N-acetyltransferase I